MHSIGMHNSTSTCGSTYAIVSKAAHVLTLDQGIDLYQGIDPLYVRVGRQYKSLCSSST